jgi:hypothetical protein
MDLQSILAELGEEKAAIVQAAIDAEKNRGIESSRKKGSENTKLLSEIARIKDAIKDTLEIDDIPSDADLKELIGSRVKKGSETSSEFEKVKRDLAKLSAQLAEKEKQEAKLQQELTYKKINEKLATHMRDAFHGSDLLIKDIISSGRVKLIDDDNVVFLDGDSEIDILKGIESVKKSRPDLVKNIQQTGGGSYRTETRNNNKQMPQVEWMKLEPKERANFVLSGGEIT